MVFDGRADHPTVEGPQLYNHGGWLRLPAQPLPAGAVNPWPVPSLLMQKLPTPGFPARDLVITDFGAVAGGTPATDAIRRAVEACRQAGGGRGVIPDGRFLTGPVHLKSGVNLHLREGATLACSIDPDDNLPVVFTRYEGVEIMGPSPLVYAFEQENIAITGTGTLDGQAGTSAWWPWAGGAENGWRQGIPLSRPSINRTLELAEAGVPVEQRVFGRESWMRPQFVQPYRCRNVLIEDCAMDGPVLDRAVRFKTNSVHGGFIENVYARNITVGEVKEAVLLVDCHFHNVDEPALLEHVRNLELERVTVNGRMVTETELLG